jgi:hypothetical protein
MGASAFLSAPRGSIEGLGLFHVAPRHVCSFNQLTRGFHNGCQDDSSALPNQEASTSTNTVGR